MATQIIYTAYTERLSTEIFNTEIHMIKTYFDFLSNKVGSRHFPSASELIHQGINFDSSQIPPFVASEWLKFDLDYLASTKTTLAKFPRYSTLLKVAKDITEGSVNDLEAFEKVVFFCQAVSKNFQARQPVSDKAGNNIVTDPLVLLTLKEMRCGHIARLAADICQTLGWRARLVQLGGHVTAEAFVSGDWRVLEADLLGGGEIPRLKDGSIPSVQQLSKEPEAIDKLFFNGESTIYATNDTFTVSIIYPSYFYFSQKAYGMTKPLYYEKVPITSDDNLDNNFGWNNYKTTDAENFTMTDTESLWTPGKPAFVDVSNRDDRYFVRWNMPSDRSEHFSGFNVFFSSSPRGFNTKVYYGDKALQKYFIPLGEMKEKDYRAIFQAPEFEHKIETDTNFLYADIDLIHKYPYVNVMPRDKYGDSIGKVRWADTPQFYLPHFDQLDRYVVPS